jgi:D-aminoacyl-tRNA deacylase
MYKNFLIVASKKDKAGINITTALSQFEGFKFHLVEEETIFTKSLDLDKINQADFVIFASKHESEKGGKTLSVHAPGNWRSADMGGEPGKVCKASAQFQKQLFENLHKQVRENNLYEKYMVTLECTHHGPLIDKPCVYIEIGASDLEWSDRKAAFTVAKAIRDTVQTFKPNEFNEIAIGIGGPHYCPNFNILQEKSNYAIAHIIPGYVTPITEEMIKEAVEKTEEEVDLAIVDWKGLGQAEQRDEVIAILDKLYIRYKRASEAKKEF